MTIRITDKRTGEELSFRDEFGVTLTFDNHLIFGWESHEPVYRRSDRDEQNYEVTFPEVEELKKENEELKTKIASMYNSVNKKLNKLIKRHHL